MAEIATPDLSDKQERILAFVRAYIAAEHFAPAIRDIQEGCDISSTSVVNYNLNILEARGYLTRRREITRSIVLRSRAGHCPTCGHHVGDVDNSYRSFDQS